MKIWSVRELSIWLPRNPWFDSNFRELNRISLIFEPHNVGFDSRVIALVRDVRSRLLWSYAHVRVKIWGFISLCRQRVFFQSWVKRCSKSLLVKSFGIQLREFLDSAWHQFPILRNWRVHNWRVPCFHWFPSRNDWWIGCHWTWVVFTRYFKFIFVFKLSCCV